MRPANDCPLSQKTGVPLRWDAPIYTKIHQVLTNPFYAGVYVYGRTQQSYLDTGVESENASNNAAASRDRSLRGRIQSVVAAL
ncbi:recombinase family protein [Bradyrhizobium sp. CCGUVB23]|uniref:recombinase family protein n=1 Tax=Bradyrhizobium sp. CCGUVB23 TaxID=2949630 RepID=UPI003532503A